MCMRCDMIWTRALQRRVDPSVPACNKSGWLREGSALSGALPHQHALNAQRLSSGEHRKRQHDRSAHESQDTWGKGSQEGICYDHDAAAFWMQKFVLKIPRVLSL